MRYIFLVRAGTFSLAPAVYLSIGLIKLPTKQSKDKKRKILLKKLPANEFFNIVMSESLCFKSPVDSSIFEKNRNMRPSKSHTLFFSWIRSISITTKIPA